MPKFSETPKQAAWFVNQGETTYLKPDNPAVSQFYAFSFATLTIFSTSKETVYWTPFDYKATK